MDILFFKSFLPEIFLSISIIFQLIFNIKFINHFKLNFPIMDQEVFSQVFLILIFIIFLFLKLKITGFSSNCIFVNDENVRNLKIFIVFICLLSIVTLVQAFSSEYLNFTEFFSLFLLALLATLLITSSNDFISFYLLIEMQSLSFYVLTAFKRNCIISTESSLRYYILGSFMSGVLLFGILLLYVFFGSSNLSVIKVMSTLTSGFLTNFYIEQYYLLITVAIFLITSFLLFKSGCAPFHIWIITVYEGSPLASTVVFTLLPKISIFCFLIRWIISLGDFSMTVLEILFFLGLLTVLIGTFFTLIQIKFKPFFIYSSISQIGFLFTSIGTNTVDGIINTYFYLFIYLISSILIWSFFSSYNYLQFKLNYYSFKFVFSNLFFSDFNLFFRTTKSSLFIILTLFSFASIPPLAGFLSKFLILLSIISQNFFNESIFLIMISSLSVLNYIRLIKIFIFEIENSLIKKFTIFQSQPYNITFTFDFFYLIVTVCFFFLVFFFFSPSGLILFCQYLIFFSQEF